MTCPHWNRWDFTCNLESKCTCYVDQPNEAIAPVRKKPSVEIQEQSGPKNVTGKLADAVAEAMKE